MRRPDELVYRISHVPLAFSDSAAAVLCVADDIAATDPFSLDAFREAALRMSAPEHAVTGAWRAIESELRRRAIEPAASLRPHQSAMDVWPILIDAAARSRRDDQCGIQLGQWELI